VTSILEDMLEIKRLADEISQGSSEASKPQRKTLLDNDGSDSWLLPDDPVKSIVRSAAIPSAKGKWQRILVDTEVGHKIFIYEELLDETSDHYDPDKNQLRAIRNAAKSLGMKIKSKRDKDILGRENMRKITRIE